MDDVMCPNCKGVEVVAFYRYKDFDGKIKSAPNERIPRAGATNRTVFGKNTVEADKNGFLVCQKCGEMWSNESELMKAKRKK